MHPGEMMMRLLAVAGMVLDLVPDLWREIALPGGRTATRLAAAALAAAARWLRSLASQVVERFSRSAEFVQLQQLCHVAPSLIASEVIR
jgi:hypothetical protein